MIWLAYGGGNLLHGFNRSILLGALLLISTACSKGAIEAGDSIDEGPSRDLSEFTTLGDRAGVRQWLSGKVLPDMRLEDSQAWQELQLTEGWISPRRATHAERESAAPCIDQLEAERRIQWDEPNLLFHRDSMQIGNWGSQSQIGFFESSIRDRAMSRNANVWVLDLATCEVVITQYDTSTIDIELSGDHDGQKVRVVHNNPRSWKREIKFHPQDKKIYKRTSMNVDEVSFVDTPAAAECSNLLANAEPDQPITRLCNQIDADSLRVKSYYEYLAVYDFEKHALRKYAATPKKLVPRGQRLMQMPAGDAVVSTHSRKFEGSETLRYPLKLRYTFTTNFEAR